MKAYLRALGEELLRCLRVVHDRVSSTIWISAPTCRVAFHLSRLHIERRIERERVVAVIFKAVPFGPPRRKWQHRIQSVERLNGGLPIHAKYGRVLWGVHIHADDAG